MPGPYDQIQFNGQGTDEDVESIRQRHHEELSAKHNQFLQMQHQKWQAHLGQQAARIYAFHHQHGDQAVHHLAKAMLIAQGPEHIHGIAQHLVRGGAHATAKALATGAMQQ